MNKLRAFRFKLCATLLGVDGFGEGVAGLALVVGLQVLTLSGELTALGCCQIPPHNVITFGTYTIHR